MNEVDQTGNSPVPPGVVHIRRGLQIDILPSAIPTEKLYKIRLGYGGEACTLTLHKGDMDRLTSGWMRYRIEEEEKERGGD